MRLQRTAGGSWGVSFQQPEVQQPRQPLPPMVSKPVVHTIKQTNWTERKRIACQQTALAIELMADIRKQRDLERYLATDEE